MPALTLFGSFTTKPLAGDDFQIVCLILGSYRAVQLLCILPLIGVVLSDRYLGKDLIANGYPEWCPQWLETKDPRDPDGGSRSMALTVNDYVSSEDTIERKNFMANFVIVAVVYLMVDTGWILATWGVASVGTPTQPMGRDKYLRKLVLWRLFSNAFPITLIAVGCWKVWEVRQDNYQCHDRTPEYYPDKTWDFAFYCILLVTYALELLFWPAVAANKLSRWIRSNKITQQNRTSAQARGERLDYFLGGLLKCLSVLCCNKSGGKELKNRGEMKDFAKNLMEFANNDTKTNIVLSDMWVGGKLLARVQAERRFSAIQALQRSHASKTRGKEEKSQVVDDDNLMNSKGSAPPTDRRALAKTARRRSILTLQTDGDGRGCVVVEKNVLTSGNSDDVEILRLTSHYSIYAMYVYWHFRMLLEDLLSKEDMTFIRDFDMMELVERLSMSKFDSPHAHLFYANFHNGIAATPYAILVDEKEKTVVITVRGTISLEDWVIDLQYVPQSLADVGKLCGFDGNGHHCHKGVLTRGKWLYNDIKKQKMLRHLFSNESMYKDYDLVVAGHSLGGGCAQVLSLMLRPSFPSLKCYAYEPPGCIFDDVLSENCKEWITSVVRHDDVVPRVTQPNLESLRDEFFDVIARIKVPKCKAFYDVRAPCPESHLASRNAKMLCPKGQVDRDTLFHQQIQKFRNERAKKNQTSEVAVKLYIPGNIIHLVDTLGDETKYVPYYASRYEFNQVVLSGRMLADHAVPPLVDILRDLNLDEIHEVRAWHESEEDEGDDDLEETLFFPCSNPQGYGPLLLVTFAVVACTMAALSNQGCKYVARSSIVTEPDGTSYPGPGVSAGLWNYNLKQCIDPENCNENEPSDLENSNYCQEFGSLYDSVNGFWTAARVFGTLCTLLGLVSIGLISLATCTRLKKHIWMKLSTLLLLISLFQGLQFLFLKSDLCTQWTNPISGLVVNSVCTISRSGIYGVVATVFWFSTSVGCSCMARM